MALHFPDTDQRVPPLTKLYNRQFLDQSLHRELLRGARGQTPVSVIIRDLDNFKMIDDEYGHNVGDEVLVTLAFQLNKAVRDCFLLAAAIGG
jgi:diguanylate cyclase (GGDEF)-like protein